MASSGAREGGGISFFGLFVILAALQLLGVIDISWWWITAPIWLPIAALWGCQLGLLLVLAIIVGCVQAARAVTPKRWWSKSLAASAPRDRLLRAMPRGRRKVYRVTDANRRRR